MEVQPPFKISSQQKKEPSFLSLFNHVASTSNHEEFILFTVISWLLWKSRNAGRHGEFAEEGSAVIWSAKEWLSAYQSAQMSTRCSGLTKNLGGTEVNWQRPLSQNVKLNTDAACYLKAKKAGVGFVLRNDAGFLIGVGSIPIPGNPSVLAIEGLAIPHGLLYSLSEGIKRVELECDAANVVFASNNEEVDLSMEWCIFDDIKVLIPDFEVIKWRKIPRSCNQVAHCIAHWESIFQQEHVIFCN